MPGPPARYPKQITPGLRPGSAAAIAAESERSGLTMSVLLRLALEKRFPNVAASEQPQPPSVPASAQKPGLVTEVPVRISDTTFAQIERARESNWPASRSEIVRFVVEETYPAGE